MSFLFHPQNSRQAWLFRHFHAEEILVKQMVSELRRDEPNRVNLARLSKEFHQTRDRIKKYSKYRPTLIQYLMKHFW